MAGTAHTKGGKGAHTGCQLSDLFRLLGEPHVLDILHLFLQSREGLRFTAVQNRLAMSPNTLTDRLKSLVQAGLLTRHAYNEIPPRVEYRATRKALELVEVFDALVGWASRNALEPVAEPPAGAVT
jgi:DNA-binding HxlR family transcriptional regulator